MNKNNSLAEKKLRNIVRQELMKINGINETDLVASDKSSWDNKKAQFKMLVQNLLTNIETDDYKDAEGEISKTISILKSWKSNIDKGLSDNKSIDEGIFGNKKQNPEQEAIKNILNSNTWGDDYTKYVVPESIDYTPTETGFMLYFDLAIPGHGLDMRVLVANNNVHSTDDQVGKDQAEIMNDEMGGTYNGENPGSYYSRVTVKYRGKKGENYMFSVSSQKGMDI